MGYTQNSESMGKDTVASIRSNYIFQVFYRLLSLVQAFLLSPFLARTIGAEGIGTYSFAYNVADYFVLFSLLGIQNYGSRRIAQERNDHRKLRQTFSDIAALHILISFFFLILYIVYAVLITGTNIYAMIFTGYVLSGLLDISWFYFGIEEFKVTVISGSFVKILTTIAIFLFVRSPEDTVFYTIIVSSGFLVSRLILWLPLRKYIKPVIPQLSSFREHFVPMLILFVPAIAVSIYNVMDKIMVGSISDRAQLGFYDSAAGIVHAPMVFITAFGTVMLPRMSNLAFNDPDRSERYLDFSLKAVFWLSTAFAFGFMAVGPTFAPVFWGKEFALSGLIIRGLAVAIPFSAISNVIRTQYLIPHHRDRVYLISVSSGAVVNLLLNTLLIRPYGALGAVIGTIAAEGIVCIIQLASIRNNIPLRKYLRWGLPYFFTGIMMFLLTNLIAEMKTDNNTVKLLLQIITGIVIYCTGSSMIAGDDERKLVCTLLKRNRN